MGIPVMGFHNAFYSNLFWEKKNDVAFIDFKVLYNSVIVTFNVCVIYLLCEYEQDLLSINWMLLSALMVSLMISYILKGCIYLTNCTLYLLFSNYCTFIVSVIMTCILMLSGEKKQQKRLSLLSFLSFWSIALLLEC